MQVKLDQFKKFDDVHLRTGRINCSKDSETKQGDDHTVPDKGTRASAQHLYDLGRKSGGAFSVELRVLHSKIRLLAARVCHP